MVCPWKFMGGLDAAMQSPHRSRASPASGVRTFASVLSNSTELPISLSQLPSPVIRGDKIYVKINESLYQEQLKQFKTNLIGRLLLRKGSQPMRTDALKKLLANLWQPLEPWRLVPLGKGYFDIHFSSEEDLRRIWGGGTCSLLNGIFRLSQWKPDFVPGDTLPQTYAQIWVRFYGLSQDYWHQQHLMEIARGVGSPLQIDKATKERQFGYFARVLVDVDLTRELPPSLMVERETHCFPIDVVYENMCTHCGKVGHMADHYRNLQPVQERKLPHKPFRIARQEYRPEVVVKNVHNLDGNLAIQCSSMVPNKELSNGADDVVDNEPIIQGSVVVSELAHKILNDHNHPIQQMVNEIDNNGQRVLELEQDPVATQVHFPVEISKLNKQEVQEPTQATPSRSLHDNEVDLVSTEPSGNTEISNEGVVTPHVLSGNNFPALGVSGIDDIADVHEKRGKRSDQGNFYSLNNDESGHDMVEENQVVKHTTNGVSHGVVDGSASGLKICWGDLENEEPLGATASAQSAIRYETWLDEGEAASDVNLLRSLPTQKNSKKKQSGLGSRYPTRNRTPIVRMNL